MALMARKRVPGPATLSTLWADRSTGAAMIEERGEGRVGRRRLIGFASGDFAFNLYWQSAMLYLLFYYTDALGLGMETAAAIYLVASCWDGVVSFAVGVLVDRYWPRPAMRRALVLGAVPLGLSFALAYAPPPLRGTAGAAVVLVGHLLFRTAYALVNIRAGVELQGGKYTIGGFARNLLNRKYLIDAGNTGGGFGIPTYIRGEPQVYGVELSGRF